MAAPDEIRVAYDKPKLVGFLFGGMAFSALGAAMAFHVFARIALGSQQEFFGWLAMLFFGLVPVIALSKLLTPSRAVLTLTGRGLTDIRLAEDEIPWTAIRRVGEASIWRQRFIVLQIDPKLEAGLRLTRFARWTRGPNRATARPARARMKPMPIIAQKAAPRPRRPRL